MMSSSCSHTSLPQRKPWTNQEDELLIELRKCKEFDWIEVARRIEGRNPSQCAQRWKRIKGFKLRKQWTEEENLLVVELVAKHGYHWSKISSSLPERTGKQIREHYLNQLHPDINNEPWTQEEDEKVIELYKEIGGKWSQISKQLNKRSENSIKNRFYSHLRNKYLNIKNPYYIVPEKKQKLNENANANAIKEQADDKVSAQQTITYSPQPLPFYQNFQFQMAMPCAMYIPIYLCQPQTFCPQFTYIPQQ